MKLTFHGAARQVTGSMFLLKMDDGYSILIDCGTDFSRVTLRDRFFPFHPGDIDLVLLTHAHLDHSGNIPILFMEGYRGQVLCTSPTLSLAEVILKDSASIHSHGLKKKLGKKKTSSRFIPDLRNVYLEKQVNEAVDRFIPIAFHKRFEVKPGLHITFIPTGHLLGAANILVEEEKEGTIKRILFSGDIGRKDYPLLEDPGTIPSVDFLVCETTYGIRKHDDKGKAEDILHDIIQKACVDIPGRLIIPSFSVGRTQSLLYTLHKLSVQKKLPPIKVFADSPMAEMSTRIYEQHIPLLNQEAQQFYQSHRSLFDFENLVLVSSFKESKAISNYTQPCIIISSSGMITGGRVEEHLKNNLSNPYCTILMVGYSAEGTPGHQLIHQKTVTLKGRTVPVTAHVITTDIFSGHGDQDDLLGFVKAQSKETLKKIFLVHGDYNSMIGFKKVLEAEGYNNVEMPKKGEEYEF